MRVRNSTTHDMGAELLAFLENGYRELFAALFGELQKVIRQYKVGGASSD